jgi:hypothetical protein
LLVGEISRMRAQGMCVGMRGDEGRVADGGNVQNPRSLRCDRSIRILNRLQALINSLPRSVRPGPVSGEEGQRNGTPCPNAFDRLQTGPRERSPASYNTSRNSKLNRLVPRLRYEEQAPTRHPPSLVGYH